jgi:hypothetical protein
LNKLFSRNCFEELISNQENSGSITEIIDESKNISASGSSNLVQEMNEVVSSFCTIIPPKDDEFTHI